MTETAVLGIIERQLEPPVIQRLLDMGLSRDEVHSVIIPRARCNIGVPGESG